VRVAEQARAGVAVQLFGNVGVGVGVVAARPQLAAAEEAVAAGDGKRHDDAVAAPEVGHAGADLDDLAHELVAEDVALVHGRDETVQKVQIGAADGVARHPDDGARGLITRGSGTCWTWTLLVPHQQTAFMGHAPVKRERAGRARPRNVQG
jgi:hypothetical protein